MEDDWNKMMHRVDNRQNWLRSACDIRHEECDFHAKGMRLIERKNASSGHSSIEGKDGNSNNLGTES